MGMFRGVPGWLVTVVLAMLALGAGGGLVREPAAWHHDPVYVYIAVAATILTVQSGLVAGLLAQIIRRRRAEDQVEQSHAELRATNDRLRALGWRLLVAQDEERSRIARELHDDVSQQTALLAMNLGLLLAASRGGRDDIQQHARDALAQAHTIARSVHNLSHRVHPAKLRLIGLVPSLAGLHRDFAQPGLTIGFTHRDVPASLPQDLAVCLFRIAQEALQNAVKHSAASHVSVTLNGAPGSIELTIADDGVGFDVEAMIGKGLGLITMRERLEPLGGHLSIHTGAGRGTRVEVIIPLHIAEPAAPRKRAGRALALAASGQQ